jgi:hypothetical protein
VAFGLPDEVISELRSDFPRRQIPELIATIAAIPRDCFASAAYLGSQIGRSARTVFRYFAELKAQGILVRRQGSREQFPADAAYPFKLRAHGYKLTGFVGWLAPFVAQGIAKRKARTESKQERKRRAREAREAQQRERRQRKAPEFATMFPDVAARATKLQDRPAPPKGPRAPLHEPDARDDSSTSGAVSRAPP